MSKEMEYFKILNEKIDKELEELEDCIEELEKVDKELKEE